MLEKETERLLRNLQERTISKGEAISVKEILAAEIPYPLKVFFRADVERMLIDELRRTRENSRFNYSHREAESLQRQINSILVLNFSFLREEFLQKLDDGVHLILNYLLRPQWTLTSFVFNTNSSVSVSDIKRMLTYFGAYEYLKEVLLRYVEEKKLESLVMNDFHNLLLRIDSEYLQRKEGAELARMTAPMYDFINFSPTPSSSAPHTIPLQTKAFVKFFEDKRLRLVCDVLEQHIAQRGVNELTMDQLGEILEQVCRTNPTAFIPDDTFIRKQTGLEADPETPTSPGPPGPPRLVEREQQTRPVLPDLMEFISGEDRRRFIKKIFKKK